MNVLKKNIGLSFCGDKWSLRIWAPDAKQVQLKLAAKEFTAQLSRAAYGYWQLDTDEISEGDRYWLIIDGKQLPDPASVSQPDGVHGASQAMMLSHNLDEQDWNNIPLKDYIFYELHVGTFSAQGNFAGIAEKLDYLADLGITAIEIMPVGSFPGQRNWGYDGVFPFAVQCCYGGPLALQELVSLCHKKGLAVVLDVVYNHLGPEGNYLSEYGPYFTDKYRTPWGNALNFDDRGAYGVREYFIENALMWFRDFHIDALRLDAVHAIKDFSAVHILQEIRRQTDLLSEHTGKDYYLIAECDLNDPRYITGLDVGGLGMHAQWVDEFHHALRVAAGEPGKGYYTDFNGISHLAKSYRDAYVYTGMYSPERDQFFGRNAAGHPGHQFVVFSQNHDHVGNRMLGERTSVLVSFEMQKLMAAAVLFSPFLPLLFMGEEWGETNPFLYFIDHTDPGLVELVRKGRRDEFAAMHASGEAPDPKSEDTFQRSKLNWEHSAEPKHRTLLQFYKQLIALRKQMPALQNGDLASIKTVVWEEKNCLLVTFGTMADQDQLFCVLNFSAVVQELSFTPEDKIYRKIIDSAAPDWLGPAAAPEEINNHTLVAQPESFLAYTVIYA